MQDILTIKKEPNLKDSQNYALLKEAGLKHIEQLASDLWTDYNEHDPGITLLEVLAYAITDLGYRTGYDVKDILTAKSEALNNHKDTFHKATQILPCNQVTELDLREILIDIKGIRNAWITIANDFENTYFVDYDKSELSVTDPASTTQEEISSLNGLYHIVVEFDRLEIPIELPIPERKAKENKVIGEAKKRLMHYRNFCEDYFVGTRKHELSNAPFTRVVRKPQGFERIVVWADVEVTPDSDKEKVHAQIYFDIEQFLIPYATFYSLQERLNQNKTIDQIFEGPLLDHGFINEDELDEIQLREKIHVSDLYQVVMDVPGVTGVKSIKIANYLSEDGKSPNMDVSIEEPSGTFNLKKLLQKRGQDWCLDLHSDASTCTFYELVLDTVTRNSSNPINNTIKFYTGENSVPVRLDTAKTLDELNVLRQNDRKRRERLGHLSFELEVPEGTYQDLNTYYPVQNELPAVYGTGLAGLADEASDERKGQAKQLKSYLLFFEQILANYLAQLNNVRYLFSWDDTIDKTYYTQVLENIKDDVDLYLEEYNGEALSDSGGLKVDVVGNLIQNDTESPEVYFDRRSRFLNHLIARFNEQFVTYSLVMHSLDKKDQLIQDKAKFLQEYDQISMNRGRGFDFSLMRNAIDTVEPNVIETPDVWDTLNVTGYQHRVCRFLGLPDHSRRFLYSGHDMRVDAHDVGGSLKYRYVLKISEESEIEIYGDFYANDLDAITQFEDLIEFKGKGLATDVTPPEVPGFGFKVSFEDGASNQIGFTDFYPNSSDRDDALELINEYFEETSGFITDVVYSSDSSSWRFTLEVSSASPPFNINGLPQGTKTDAENDLDVFLAAIKADSLSFAPISPGMVTNAEFYFEVFNGVDLIGYSDHETFAGTEALMHAGMAEAEAFFDDNAGYKLTEGGLHVVEHILLRPKTDDFSLFDVDVRQYDSIATAENPPVAYPVDYNGVYRINDYHDQYYLAKEVELTSNLAKNSAGEYINRNGEIVNVIEPFFYTLSANQLVEDPRDGMPTVSGTEITWEDFFIDIRDGDASKYQLTGLGSEQSVDDELWTKLIDDGYGCEYANYTFGTTELQGLTLNYYLIVDGNTVLGGLVSAALSSSEVKERALRSFAYFCDNTTCKGVSNPYEFKATVILPGWTVRARDYNYRAYAEEIIRIEAPAHIAIDIKWVSRSQMRDFEICYRDWLMRQGEYLHLDREIQNGLVAESVEAAAIGADGLPFSWTDGATTNVSNQFLKTLDASNCLIKRIDSLIDVFRSVYKTIIRNNQFFTNAAATTGYKMAWIGVSADGSVVNKAEIVGGILPDFLAFFDGENFIHNSGVVTPGDGVIPGSLEASNYNAGDFFVINPGIVPAGTWSFSVKTYSDTGQVSCTTVTIEIIQDIEARYISHPECYSHLVVGDIVSEIEDANGVIVSASILGGTLPESLKLITDYTDRLNWATLRGLDENLYQPGDIVVDSSISPPVIHPVIHPVNDNIAIPSEGNVIVNLTVQVTDITGGITVFTNAINPLNDGAAPGFVPIKIYGNAALIKSPETCTPRHIATFNTANQVYPNPSDLLYTFSDAHEPNGITISSASIVTEPNSGVGVRVVNGRAEVYVDEYILFEPYIESLPSVDGVVTFPILDLQVVDSCGFPSEWSGTFCVKLDTEAQAEPTITTCAGNYYGNPEVVSITDADDGIHSFSIDPAVQANLSALGVSYALVNGTKITFSVTNSAAFRAAIEHETIFNGTEIVDGIEVNTYSFEVDTVDKMGGTSTVNVAIYAPVNGPLECIKAYPDGTSYLAYLNQVSQWNSKIGYTESTQKVGKTVMTFSDPNGIASISYSCKKCDGTPFDPKGGGVQWWTNGVLNEQVKDNTKYGDNIGIYLDKANSGSQKAAPNSPKKASKSVRKRKGRSNVSEYAWKVNPNESHTAEKYVKNDLYSKGGIFQYDPYDPKPGTEDCLQKIGLSLDTTSNRIFVSDSKKFIEKGIGTHKFSIIVTDRCGITTCKEVTLIIGDDRDAYYIDVKNKSYLNSLKSGDVIGYPEDPDGGITQARIVLYNKATELLAMPHTPQLLLPPGTMFNTFTGEIKVMQKAVQDEVIPYKGSVNNMKGKGKSSKGQKYQRTTSPKSKPQSNASGFSMFAKGSSGKKKKGVAMHNADIQNKTEELVSPKIEQDSAYFNNTSFANIWLTNPGKLTHGTWTIDVLTKDVLGGLTVITYTIVIKKNKKIKGVLENVGYAQYGNVKADLANNYSNILTKKVNESTQVPDISVKSEAVQTQTQQIQGLSAIDTSKGKSL